MTALSQLCVTLHVDLDPWQEQFAAAVLRLDSCSALSGGYLHQMRAGVAVADAQQRRADYVSKSKARRRRAIAQRRLALWATSRDRSAARRRRRAAARAASAGTPTAQN